MENDRRQTDSQSERQTEKKTLRQTVGKPIHTTRRILEWLARPKTRHIKAQPEETLESAAMHCKSSCRSSWQHMQETGLLAMWSCEEESCKCSFATWNQRGRYVQSFTWTPTVRRLMAQIPSKVLDRQLLKIYVGVQVSLQSRRLSPTHVPRLEHQGFNHLHRTGSLTDSTRDPLILIHQIPADSYKDYSSCREPHTSYAYSDFTSGLEV